MIDRLERVFLVGVFPLAFALAGCDVQGALPPLDGGVGGTSCGVSGSCGSLDGGSGGSASGGSGGQPGDASTPAVNLWADASFETGMTGWVPVGNAVLSRSTDASRTGAASLRVGNRAMNWEGPGHDLLSAVSPEGTYELAAWVRLASVAENPAEMHLTVKRRCEGDPEQGMFTPLATASVGAEWTLLQGSLAPQPCDPLELVAFIEMSYLAADTSTADFYVDDVSLMAVP